MSAANRVTAEELERVLAAHSLKYADGWGGECVCDYDLEPTCTFVSRKERIAAHCAHVAAQILALLESKEGAALREADVQENLRLAAHWIALAQKVEEERDAFARRCIIAAIHQVSNDYDTARRAGEPSEAAIGFAAQTDADTILADVKADLAREAKEGEK